MEQTTAVEVRYLVSEATLRAIGARDRMEKGADWVAWMVNRPSTEYEAGPWFLTINRRPDGFTVALRRKGMCADVYTEAISSGVAEQDVDATVLAMCQQGSRWRAAS